MSAGRYPAKGALSTDSAPQLGRTAGALGLGTLASRALGLARDMAIARLLAVGSSDIFFVAFTLPDLARRLVGEGALGLTIVPLLARAFERDPAAGRRAVDAALTLAALGAVGVVSLLVLAAPLLADVLAPGLTESDRAVAAGWLRWVAPYVGAIGLCAVGQAALQARGEFGLTVASPMILNVVLLACLAVAWSGALDPLAALSLGVALAGLAQLAVTIGALYSHGLRPRFRLRLGELRLRDLVRALAPLALAAVLAGSGLQLLLIGLRVIASGLGPGAISELYYAGRLIELPLGIFVFAIAAASLPRISGATGVESSEALAERFQTSLRLSWVLALPAAAGLAVLADPICGTLFNGPAERFGEDSARDTAWALRGLAPALLAMAWVRLVSQVLIALRDVSGVVAGGTAMVLVGGALAALALPLGLDIAGLAAGASTGVTVAAILLAIRLRIRHPALLDRTLLARLARPAMAGAAMSLAVLAVEVAWPTPIGGSVAVLAGVVAKIAFGAAFYFALLWQVAPTELDLLRAALRRPAD